MYWEFSEMSTLITLLSCVIVFSGCHVLLQNCNGKKKFQYRRRSFGPFALLHVVLMVNRKVNF